MKLDERLGLFDPLVVLMLENRSFDNLFGYLYERDKPRHFIPDEDHAYRGVAGRDDLVNYDAGEPPREYRVQKAPWERLEDMYAPYPNAGEFYKPNINRQVYGTDSVSGDIEKLPTENLMRGFVQDYMRAVEEAKSWDGNVQTTPEVIQQIMNCLPPEAVPVLSTLADRSQSPTPGTPRFRARPGPTDRLPTAARRGGGWPTSPAASGRSATTNQRFSNAYPRNSGKMPGVCTARRPTSPP